MLKKLSLSILVGVFLFSGAVYAQTEDTLPDAGITPDNPFFFLERFVEELGNTFTFDAQKKAERFLHQAEERLAEAEILARANSDKTQEATELYEKQLERAQERTEALQNVDMEAKFEEARTRHISTLDKVLERVPEQAKERIAEVRKRALERQFTKLEQFKERAPERLAEILEKARERRLKAAERASSENEDGDDEDKENLTEEEQAERRERNAERVKRNLDAYRQYAEFQDDFTPDSEEVRARIKEAQANHLERLREVEQMVPDQAKERIRRAIERSDVSAPGMPQSDQINVQKRSIKARTRLRDAIKRTSPAVKTQPADKYDDQLDADIDGVAPDVKEVPPYGPIKEREVPADAYENKTEEVKKEVEIEVEGDTEDETQTTEDTAPKEGTTQSGQSNGNAPVGTGY